jgi:predicted peroxiredoxin
MTMKLLSRLLLPLALLIAGALHPVHAGDTDPLFINLSTDEPQRALAGLTFGLHQHENGHPLTLFLNDRGVLLGSRSHADKLAEPQRLVAELIQRGAVVLIAPPSMKHYGVREDDLLPGVQLSNRKLSGEALFRGTTRALSW